MKRIAILFFCVLPLSGWADDSPVEPVKKARKATKPKPKPKPCPTCPVCPEPPDVLPCPEPRAIQVIAAPEELPVVEEPIQTPRTLPPLPIIPDDEGAVFGVTAWGLAGFTGQANRVTYGGRVSADGPIASLFTCPLRMTADLDIGATPGVALDLAIPETFSQSAELTAGVYLRLAERKVQRQEGSAIVTHQLLTTSLFFNSGFATMLDDRLQDRYVRRFSVGIRLAEEKSGAELLVGYCRNEAAGYIGSGQICVAGEVPIAGTNGVFRLGGDAVLNLSRASITPQRDILRVFVGVGLGDLLKLMGRN